MSTLTPLDVEPPNPLARKLAVIIDGAFVGCVVILGVVAVVSTGYVVARVALDIAPIWWWILVLTVAGGAWGVVEALRADRRHGWWR